MMLRFCFGTLLLLSACAGSGISVESEESEGGGAVNEWVMTEVEAMPEGGDYSVRDDAFEALERGLLRVADGHDPGAESCPSFCSSATWLIFLGVLERRGVELDRLAGSGINPLLQDGSRRPDGSGLWGRWNANGPGAAVLLHQAGLGRSFTDLDQARPGDFLKLWWTEDIGGAERGHLVIFLGWSDGAQERSVRFWSANEARENLEGGYGERVVPWSEVERALVSRLMLPAQVDEIIRRLTALPTDDPWLESLQREDVSWAEVLDRSGVTP